MLEPPPYQPAVVLSILRRSDNHHGLPFRVAACISHAKPHHCSAVATHDYYGCGKNAHYQSEVEDTLLKRLFQRPIRPVDDDVPLVGGRPPRLPDGMRVYAIGDVHGRIDLVRRMEEMIIADRAAQATGCHDLLVYLGDYVDRGDDSNQVLDHLAADPPDGFARVLLLGNHDLWLRMFLAGEFVGDDWVRYGGDATLLSYGVPLAFDKPEEIRLPAAREAMLAKVPEAHRQLLDNLELTLPLGDYLFCHAGIRPGVPLDKQEKHDVIWIREPFLSWNGDCGKIVVHGHTITDRPVVRRNRIGIDTGAYSNGNLTCLVLEGDMRRFLSTAAS